MNPLRRAGHALAAVALLTGAMTATAHADAAPAPIPDTSWIRLDSLSPAVIPTKGAITLTGTLHNGSGETWHHLVVEPATSQHALTSAEGVAYYATFDPAQVHLGSAMPERRDSLPNLASGNNLTFRITIPRASLQIDGNPGVYWLGVTPISDETHPASLTARTFLPLLAKVAKKTQVNVSIVVPLRENPLRLPNGQIADPTGFASLLSADGRLGRIAAFGTSAGARALTWIVDPALLDIADQAAAGVADYGLGTVGSSPPPKPSPTPSPSAPASPSATSSGHPTHLAPDLTPAQAEIIRGWSASVTSLLRASAASFALPYGDPIVSPLVASHNDALLSQATALSEQRMTDRNLPSQPAVAPDTGILSAPEWNALGSGSTAFVALSATQTASAATGGRTLVVASSATDGGPGPVDMQSALNIRQRVLSEAALAAGSGTTHNLTVVLPSLWDPGAAAKAFFAPLTRPWISFTGLPRAAGSTVALAKTPPAVTSTQLSAISAASALANTATQIPDLLAAPNGDKVTLARQLQATALSTLSLSARSNPSAYIGAAQRTVQANNATLSAIRVEGTAFVTLSGSTGVITVAVHNGLNVAIRVKLRQIDLPDHNTVTVNPTGLIDLEPGERTTVRLDVSAPRVSVQEVTISAVGPSGYAVGSSLTFTLRSSQVGAVAWAITIAVVFVLVLLAARGVRRRRKAKREAT